MLNGKNVMLVAEDDLDDQEFIQEAIEAACSPSVEVHFVTDGIALIEYLRHDGKHTTKPAFILLDLNMPRKDGRAALREMKADLTLADIPVVVLTTSNSEEDRSLCQRLGAEGFYRKPSRAKELEAIFSHLCTQYIP